jgi:ATP-dependent protease ClpP protease subunit
VAKKNKKKTIGEVYIFGHIDEVSSQQAIEELVKFEKEGLQIEVYINTTGGDPFSALAVHDYMRNLSSYVITIAIGHVDSAGLMIFLAGDERWITKNASIMLHRGRVHGVTELHEDTASRIAKDIKFVEDKEAHMVADATKLSVKEVRAFVASGKRFDAKEAVKCGLAHKVI